MYEIRILKEYKRNYKKLSINDKNLTDSIINKLSNNQTLEPKHKDHKLKGEIKTLENVISNQTYCLSIKNKMIN